jgi:putative transposase
MYEWRKMTPDQRAEVMRMRQQCQLPWHSPPHFGNELNLYHITSACYEHRKIINHSDRLTAFESALISGLNESGIAEVRAWVVLPNHYHLLVKTSLPKFGKWIHRLHNMTATKWNGEDDARGRKIWHGYADRAIRGDIHFYRTLNYIHANPVTHGFALKGREWLWSSYGKYKQHYGRDTLVQWWRDYPITGYGKGWDD